MKQGRSEGAEATVLIVIISSHATARQAPGSRRAVPVDPREWDEARFESNGRSRSFDQNTACVLVVRLTFTQAPSLCPACLSRSRNRLPRLATHSQHSICFPKKKKFDCQCKYSRLEKSPGVFCECYCDVLDLGI